MMEHRTTVILDFFTPRPLTAEEIQRLHIHVYGQMMLNRQAGAEFLTEPGVKFSILGENREPVVLFDSIGRAYHPGK